MRSIAIGLAAALSLAACGKGERAGIEAAKREAEQEAAARDKAHEPAKVMHAPVRGEAKIPCSQLIDPAAYQKTLEEKEPLTVKSKGDPDATSSCGLFRGGKRPTEAEQKEIIKRQGRLGVLPGDELCYVSASCSTVTDADNFRKRCKDLVDETMGSFACVQMIHPGADDVPVFKFFDADTRCIIQVGGGPSNVSADSIRTCAKVARDTIGPDQIAVGRAPAAAAGSSGE
jgi:hypothetical protein